MTTFNATYISDLIQGVIKKRSSSITLLNWRLIATNLGIYPSTKMKRELTLDVAVKLFEAIKYFIPENLMEFGFPIFNHMSEVFWNNTNLKMIIEEINQEIHTANILITQIRYQHQQLGQNRLPIQAELPTKEVISIDTELSPEEIGTKTCLCGLVLVSGEQQTLTCLDCQVVYHRECLHLEVNDEEVQKSFECPKCTLFKCDPLSPVQLSLIPLFVVDNKSRDFMVTSEMIRQVQQQNWMMEVRCLSLEDHSHEQCWPNSGFLRINQKLHCQFQPLPSNSCLKKRKDERYQTMEMEIGLNSIMLVDKKNPSNYVAGVFLVKKIGSQDLIESIKSKSISSFDDCQQRNIANFQSTEIDIDRVSYPLTCLYDMQLLKTPAKGRYCQHLNCFSLENYIGVWERNEQRKWLCPICKVKSYDLIIDGFWVEVLKKVKLEYQTIDFSLLNVSIFKDGSYEILCDEVDDGSESESENQDGITPGLSINVKRCSSVWMPSAKKKLKGGDEEGERGGLGDYKSQPICID